MKESLENVHESIRLQYQKAVSSTKETTLFNDVLTSFCNDYKAINTILLEL